MATFYVKLLKISIVTLAGRTYLLLTFLLTTFRPNLSHETMCYHVSNELSEGEISQEFRLPERKLDHYTPRFDFNGFERPWLPVISIENPKELTTYRWKLIPSDIPDDNQFKTNTLNARNDTLFGLKSYREYWRNRCLVLCTGFFEPHYPEVGGKEHESWYIKPKNKKLFALGAIYSVWQGMPTFSIVTTDASPLMAKVHNDGERQPLVLTGKHAGAWLNPNLTQGEMESIMLFQYPDEDLETYRTIDGIYNTRKDTNVPDAIKPYERPPFDALSLFLND